MLSCVESCCVLVSKRANNNFKKVCSVVLKLPKRDLLYSTELRPSVKAKLVVPTATKLLTQQLPICIQSAWTVMIISVYFLIVFCYKYKKAPRTRADR